MTKNRTLRLPDELDAWLRVRAAEEAMSVHAQILALLEDAKDEYKADSNVKPTCTCTPAERVKGKHNKWCPAK